MWLLRGRPFGLRGRIVGAVLITAVATLTVAAVALLGPLESSLRNAEKATLRKDLSHQTIARFAKLHLADVPQNAKDTGALSVQQGALYQRLGATVNVFAYPGPYGTVTAPLLRTRDNDDTGDSYDDVDQSFRTGADVYSFGNINGFPQARASIHFLSGGRPYVLAVRKPIGDLPGAVHAVRVAFLDAALAALGLTIIFGIPLSGRLVRRLRRLREAALEMTQKGLGVEGPVDRAHDEVGDLARTLSTMQHRLRQQEEARRAFVATASHELRTPLTSLDGMLEMLNEDLADEDPDLEDARALVARAHVQSRRLGRLAADLLDLSRLDAQVGDLRSEPVELAELSRAVLAEFELGAGQQDVRSALEDEVGAVWALGDPGSIARILRILLDNALRASPAGSQVTVRLQREPTVAISVCDEGPGVPEEEREAIFERFHRGRDTAGQAGFGLGLAIGRELAERMGGHLVLEQPDGSGATFTLRLPTARAPQQEAVTVA